LISVFGSDVGDAEIEAVSACMRSQWLGFGRNVESFENAFAERLGLASFAMVDSGSNALFLALHLMDLPRGSEVIVPAFTWVSCAQAVLLAGLKPVFCDVDLHTMNVRAGDVEACLSYNTSAIMVVHYAGLPVEMDEIQKLGLPILEDAAHAVDSRWRERACGSIGDVGIYSFDAVKNLTAGEGGGITAADPERIQRAKHLRYCGIGKSGFDTAADGAPNRWWEYAIREPFIKMLPTNLAAAIASVQLTRLNELQERRRAIWQRYDAELSDIDQIVLPAKAGPGDRHGLFTYCIRAEERDALAHALLKAGIYTTLRYHPLHLNELYGQTGRTLPNCERLNVEALSIPLHPRLSETDVEQVIAEIRRFYR
jgi:dTDP-4-amino-4,6-dideoxygalactose transaminase